ncbi:hypothetical protein V5799_024557 [Amblyomma americanum]|uniref:DDE-1 domain-containing protein n=1 Tax=Amblyomma americanum TaxID=6943 RepID=A0AAQ4EC22_AMBAM
MPKPPNFEEKLVAFQGFVIKKRLEKQYSLGQIGNGDQTPVYFDMPVAYTVNEKGAKQAKVRTAGYEKQCLTMMLCCMADGQKLPPFLNFERKTLPSGEVFLKNVVVRAQENGWMSGALVEDWVKTVWQCRAGALLFKQSLLVLDSYRGHLTDGVKSVLSIGGTDITAIPTGMTSQLQLLDVAINKPFQDRLRKHYYDWLMLQDHQPTPAGRIKRASHSQVVNWVAAAWEEIPSELIVRAFHKGSVSNVLDGSEDTVLWEEASDKEDSDVDKDDE